MKIALTREHRKTLETVIAQARGVAESGAVKTLQALAVGAKEAPDYFTKDQIKLRVRTGGSWVMCLLDARCTVQRIGGWRSLSAVQCILCLNASG